jgi:hypothetical protein
MQLVHSILSKTLQRLEQSLINSNGTIAIRTHATPFAYSDHNISYPVSSLPFIIMYYYLGNDHNSKGELAVGHAEWWPFASGH